MNHFSTKLEYAFSQLLLQQPDLLKLIATDRPLVAEQGIQIYCNNIQVGLYQALEVMYPLSQKVLGASNFKQLAFRYIKATPPQDNNLNLYGTTFSNFLETFFSNKTEYQGIYYLPTLAETESLLHQAYYAPSKKTFDIQRFLTLSEKQMEKSQLNLASDIGLINANFNLEALLNWAQTDCTKELQLEKQAFFAIVERKELRSCLRRINKADWQALTLISQGTCLANLSENILSSYGKLPSFQNYIANAWVDSWN